MIDAAVAEVGSAGRAEIVGAAGGATTAVQVVVAAGPASPSTETPWTATVCAPAARPVYVTGGCADVVRAAVEAALEGGRRGVAGVRGEADDGGLRCGRGSAGADVMSGATAGTGLPPGETVPSAISNVADAPGAMPVAA